MEVVYPVVGQKTLQKLVDEFQVMGFDFEREVQEKMRSSYGHHYRRMLMPVLDALAFRSNNTIYLPVIEAIAILQANRDGQRQYYDADQVPLDGIVPKKWLHIVLEKGKDNAERHQPHQLRDLCAAHLAQTSAYQGDLGRRRRPLPRPGAGPAR